MAFQWEDMRSTRFNDKYASNCLHSLAVAACTCRNCANPIFDGCCCCWCDEHQTHTHTHLMLWICMLGGDYVMRAVHACHFDPAKCYRSVLYQFATHVWSPTIVAEPFTWRTHTSHARMRACGGGRGYPDRGRTTVVLFESAAFREIMNVNWFLVRSDERAVCFRPI